MSTKDNNQQAGDDLKKWQSEQIKKTILKLHEEKVNPEEVVTNRNIGKHMDLIRSKRKRPGELFEVETISGKLVLDSDSGFITLNNVVSELSPASKEFMILETIARKEGSIATYAELGYEQQKTRFDLQQTIKKIKMKLGILGKTSENENIIKSVPTIGYKLILPD